MGVVVITGLALQRLVTGTIAWQESITPEFNDANVELATEGAARNNIDGQN